MIPKDILEKVRRIEITTSRLVTDVFAGQYHSVFKGRGMEFDEVREYQIGDDIRSIDRNVTARTGRPHVKKFVEEREMTVMVMVDASRSAQFGTVHQLKSKLAAELAAVLAFSATRNNDKIGLIIFTDQIEKFIPPRKGLRHVLRVIREILYFKPSGRSTDLVRALNFLNQVTKRKSVSFILSDFYPSTLMTNLSFKQALSIANKRHDVIAITLNDPREMKLPSCGLIALEDAETGEARLVDTGDKALCEQYHKNALQRIKERELFFRSIGVDQINVSTEGGYVHEIAKFFIKRRKRLI